LTDFGETKVISNNNSPQRTVGTLLWMAPEVLTCTKNYSYSFSADMWSFGMVIYEMMTLQIPYYEHAKNFGVENLIKDGKRQTLDSQTSDKYAPIIPIWKSLTKFNPDERPTVFQALSIFSKKFIPGNKK